VSIANHIKQQSGVFLTHVFSVAADLLHQQHHRSNPLALRNFHKAAAEGTPELLSGMSNTPHRAMIVAKTGALASRNLQDM
jgi:hypothetical protein